MNRAAFARQGVDLQTGWMTIGEWFASHPPLSKRVAALDPSLAALVPSSSRGPARALAILGCLSLVPLVAAGVAVSQFPGVAARAGGGCPFFIGGDPPQPPPAASSTDSEDSRTSGPRGRRGRPSHSGEGPRPAVVAQDILRLSSLLESERQRGASASLGRAAAGTTLVARSAGDDVSGGSLRNRRRPVRYEQSGGEYVLWSVGPDAESDTDDDIVFDSRVSAASRRPSGPPMGGRH